MPIDLNQPVDPPRLGIRSQVEEDPQTESETLAEVTDIRSKIKDGLRRNDAQGAGPDRIKELSEGKERGWIKETPVWNPR